MFCTKCGASLADDAKFCTSCGSKVGNSDTASASESKTEETVDKEVRTDEPTQNSPEKINTEESKAEEPVDNKPAAEETVSQEKSQPETEQPEVAQPGTAQPETVTEESDAEQAREVVSPFDSPKKKGGAGIIIAAGVVAAAIVVVLVLYMVVFKSMLGFNKFKKAMEDDKYKDAKKIVKEYKLDDSKKAQAAADLVIAEIDEIKNSYKSGDIDLEEAKDLFDKLKSIKLDDAEDDLDETDDWVEKMEESESNFKVGKSSYEDEYYEGAIEYLKKVDKEAKDYADAQKLIGECSDKMVDVALSKAEEYIGYGSYKYAVDYLVETKDKVGEDNKALNDAIKSIENKIVEDAINKAEGESYLSSKFSYINNALEAYPDNAELKAKYAEYSENAATDDYENYILPKFESNYYTADDISSLINNYIDTYSDNEAYANKMKELVAGKVAEIRKQVADALDADDLASACDSFGYYKALASEEEKDVVDYYCEYLEGTRLEDMDRNVTNGSFYKEYSYDVPKNGKEFKSATHMYVSSYSDESGEVEFAAEGIGAVSGFVTRGKSKTKGRVVIFADSNIVANIVIDKTKDYPINAEIPEGTQNIRIKWAKSGDDAGEYYLGDVVFTKKYYDKSKDTMLEKLKGNEASGDKEDVKADEDKSDDTEDVKADEDKSDDTEDVKADEDKSDDTEDVKADEDKSDDTEDVKEDEDKSDDTENVQKDEDKSDDTDDNKDGE